MLHTAPSVVIGDRYELQRELARGGMGSVWVAKDGKLRRSVAVKVMVPMWADSPDATTRFEREAMAVAQLQSPHVVQIFDYGVEQGCPYIVMELLEGEDLRQRLQHQERLDLETTGKVLVQTAKALSVAHAVGIVHRDLKPGNIFLARSRDEEIVKVLDFGVAKVDQDAGHKEEKTKAGTLLGTPQYMSPEQARGLPNIDHRADLWSLAVIVYRALTGRLPFNGKSAADVIVKICTQDPPRPTMLAPDLPAEVDRFFKRAFARDPSARFENARQMAIAFSRIAPTSFPSLSMPDPLAGLPDTPAPPPHGDGDGDEPAVAPWTGQAGEDHPSGRFVPRAGPPRSRRPSEQSFGRSAPLDVGAGATDDALGASAPRAASSGSVLDLLEQAAPAPSAPGLPAGSYPFGEPGALASPQPSPASDSGAIPSVSNGTLPSGLVDATHAPVSKRRSPVLFVALALALVAAGVGGVLGSGLLGAEGPAAAATGLTPEPSETLAPPEARPAATEPTPAPTAAPTGASTAEPTPTETTTASPARPGRPRPPASSKDTPGSSKATATATTPPPPPPTAGGDPFKDRL